jgi:hypothetical protein
MSQRVVAARKLSAALLIGLGLIILVRGIVEGAPLTFTLMGALMIALGLYRLRMIRAGIAGRR